MSSVENNKSAGGEASDGVGAGENVDRIREILFGTQQRELEKKLVKLEERLASDAAALREESKKRFDSLNLYLKKEMESIGERLKAEQEERAEKVAQVTRELKEFGKATEKRMTQLDDQASKHQHELRKQLLEQGEELAAEFRRLHQELKSALDGAVRELSDEKASRSALANLFTEMALRLNNEFKIPSADSAAGKAARAGRSNE